jgi:hypothetical protein
VRSLGVLLRLSARLIVYANVGELPPLPPPPESPPRPALYTLLTCFELLLVIIVGERDLREACAEPRRCCGDTSVLTFFW